MDAFAEWVKAWWLLALPVVAAVMLIVAVLFVWSLIDAWQARRKR